MIQADPAQAFEGLLDQAASTATAPILALGIGVMLFLLCDIIDFLKPARALAFVGSLAASFLFQLRILFADQVPGSVLEGTFAANHATALWGLIFLLSSLFAWIYSIGYYRSEKPFMAEHDALLLCAPAGMMLMVGAQDLIVFFIGLELLSIPLYALAAFRRARATSVEAGLKYFLLGSFSSALFLYGAALIYATAGTVSIVELVERDLGEALAIAGLALMSASLLFKVSVFPFHLWAPDVYQGSPTPITALMATGTKAAAFGFLVVQMTPLLPAGASVSVALLALVTMALGNLGALVQEDLKRMLAYSGVAHAGTLLLVVAAGAATGSTDAGRDAALFYMGAYLFTAMGAFGILSLLEADGEHFTRLDSLRGLASSRPGLAALMTLFMLSLGGIPATGGFLGKWFVFSALVRADMIGIAIVGALLSVVALGYYLRVIVVMYMHPAPEGQSPPATRRLSAGVASVCCGVFVVAMGVLPALFLRLLDN